MTPPDSGDRKQIAQWQELMRRAADEGGVQVIVPPICIVCWLPATRGLPEDGGKLYWCDKHGPFYDKPDSGEREAMSFADALNVVAKHHELVTLSPDLVQRILAALEEQVEFVRKSNGDSAPLLGVRVALLSAIASELRAAVERKL